MRGSPSNTDPAAVGVGEGWEVVIGRAPPGEGRRPAPGWRARGSGDGRRGCAGRGAGLVGPSGRWSWGRPARWPRLGPTAGRLRPSAHAEETGGASGPHSMLSGFRGRVTAPGPDYF